MTIPKRVPVLISGGGPSGLSIALELAVHGVHSLVVEPREHVTTTRPRAKTTNARTMELFRRWNVAQAVRDAAPIPVAFSNRVTFCSTVTGREVTHFDGVFGLDLADSELTAEAGQQVPQSTIEQVLRSRARATGCVQMLTGARVVSIDEQPDTVSVTVEDAAGTPQKVVAQQVVGADGPRSLVRSAIGTAYVGSDGGRPNVSITFRSELLAGMIPHPASVQYWVLNPESPGVVGPLDLNGTWWAISTGTARVENDDHAVCLVRDLVGADVDVEVVATDPWQARMLLADSYGRGRVHIVGDAAHQNPPWGGHGFNTGVGDSANLGWKLAAVIQGWAPPALLETYESERRPVAESVIGVARGNMRMLSVDLTDPALMAHGPVFEAARAKAAREIQRTKAAEFHSLGLVLGMGYTPQARAQMIAIGIYRPAVVPGARLPHRRLADGSSVFDLLGTGFTLIGDSVTGPLAHLAKQQNIPLTVVPNLLLWPGTPCILVRPDQIVAWAGEALSDVQASAVLDAALGGMGPGSAAILPWSLEFPPASPNSS